uniref:Oligoribonuclease n=1 Tax=Candidatus Aschnera chinzeii TaxID=1485666 RepID=A0AAT9G3V6_9ENTR|nr:MAG: oligoribonuclease [Candidatus Aschnera chinzeii]
MSINNNLIWIDLEMTGLNPEHDRIIEIACIVTDSDLNILSEISLPIYQDQQYILHMDEWNQKIHHKTGLINKIKSSNFTEKTAEIAIIDFLIPLIPKGVSPICGNNIAHDRRFLFKYMSKLEKYFHYRCLDVSSLKELVYRWKPEILLNFKKKNTHQALEDVRESIAELIYYRTYFLNV